MIDIPRELHQAVKDELRIKEQIKWIRQPIPYKTMVSQYNKIKFFVPWTAFSILWMIGIYFQEEAAPYFPLFGLFLFLPGLGFLLSPFWQHYKAKKTAYVITNNRVFILEKIRRVTITNYFPYIIKSLDKKIMPDGSGDLIFNTTHFKRKGKSNKVHGFFAIEGIREAEVAINSILENNE